MPNTKMVKRKSCEATEQDKRLRELKKQKLEADLEQANNQEQALNILRELLFLTNDKEYAEKMHNKYGFQLETQENEPEQCCSKTLQPQEEENEELNNIAELQHQVQNTLEQIERMKKQLNVTTKDYEEHQKQKNIIEISDEDDELLEGCCDNITKTPKCIEHELDNSVSNK